MIKKLMDKGFLLSVGLASLGRENAEKIIRKLIKKGKLSEKEGRRLVRDLVKKSKAEKKKIESKIITVRKTKVKRKPKKRKKRTK